MDMTKPLSLVKSREDSLRGLRSFLIGVCAAGAAADLPSLCWTMNLNGTVQVIVTEGAAKYFDKPTLGEKYKVYSDEDEWGYPVHERLAAEANFLILAPIDANTMSKISHDVCDNLLTKVVKSWDVNKPFMIAPDLSPSVMARPSTKRIMDTLKAEEKAIMLVDEDEKTVEMAGLPRYILKAVRAHEAGMNMEVYLARKLSQSHLEG